MLGQVSSWNCLWNFTKKKKPPNFNCQTSEKFPFSGWCIITILFCNQQLTIHLNSQYNGLDRYTAWTRSVEKNDSPPPRSKFIHQYTAWEVIEESFRFFVSLDKISLVVNYEECMTKCSGEPNSIQYARDRDSLLFLHGLTIGGNSTGASLEWQVVLLSWQDVSVKPKKHRILVRHIIIH